MKAITLIPGTTHVQLVDCEEPQIAHPDEVKLKVLEVGICGTDREEVSGGRADAPAGKKELIIGHEMLGEVVGVGPKVNRFAVGDLAVVTVRRGCAKCGACLADRSDLCYTGEYTERGIKGRDGFQAQWVVDREPFLVKVASSLRSCGVLSEPTSVVEKAIAETLALQKSRLPDWNDLSKKQAFVVGLGPIGLLACIILRLRGCKVYGLDATHRESRAQILAEIGGTYLTNETVPFPEIPTQFGFADFLLEAVGNAELDFQLFSLLACNGAYVLTGVAHPAQMVSIAGGQITENLVLKNQLLLGSVNAAKKHWELAAQDLEKAHQKWPTLFSKLLTSHIPYPRFKEALSLRSEQEIKCVLTWDL